MFEEENAYIARATSHTSQMPTLFLTAEQAEQVRPILELQKARKFGCLAVVNIGVDRTTGERTFELTEKRRNAYSRRSLRSEFLEQVRELITIVSNAQHLSKLSSRCPIT